MRPHGFMWDYLRWSFFEIPPSSVQLEVFTDVEIASRPRPQCLLR